MDAEAACSELQGDGWHFYPLRPVQAHQHLHAPFSSQRPAPLLRSSHSWSQHCLMPSRADLHVSTCSWPATPASCMARTGDLQARSTSQQGVSDSRPAAGCWPRAHSCRTRAPTARRAACCTSSARGPRCSPQRAWSPRAARACTTQCAPTQPSRASPQSPHRPPSAGGPSSPPARSMLLQKQTGGEHRRRLAVTMLGSLGTSSSRRSSRRLSRLAGSPVLPSSPAASHQHWLMPGPAAAPASCRP